DDSRDLDQLSVAKTLPDGDVKLFVAIADVDAAVAKNSPVDRHAAQNTTSVYTPSAIFPMLPERLSTDLTSLADQQAPLSVVAELSDELPPAGDSVALAAFVVRRRKAAPDRFPDLSTTIIKMIGSGEYVVDPPGAEPPGHFGLAVRDYTHSTAPNRRYPDLI